MEALKVDQIGPLDLDYDEEADVLYVSFGKPQPALSIDMGGILLNYRPEDSLLVGITIINARRMLEKGAPAQATKPAQRRRAKRVASR
ncbi:MAG: DUF2283 domain-containing protein [Chloroflexota bacterium]